MNLQLLLTRLFGRPEEMKGPGVCPKYLFRWTLAKFFGHAIYVHKFVGDDWSYDLHDHPRRFVSVGLHGAYLEETPLGTIKYQAPWFRTFPAHHTHRVSLLENKPCWTLVMVLPKSQEWGFYHDGRWIHWTRFVHSREAIKSLSC